ncbi:hypothetical protein [Comamonas piscis]|nr:hypothetical protein [Comamonas piscis]WSO32821.1 hypothetical protein VUJ63_16925 [Comamonas piscis]
MKDQFLLDGSQARSMSAPAPADSASQGLLALMGQMAQSPSSFRA